MSYETTLTEEVDAIIQAKIDKNEPLHPLWIAQQVVLAHSPGLVDGDDKLFWLHAGHIAVRKVVLDRVRRVAGTTVTRDAQLSLPGFDHIQSHYMVMRDGDEVAIPTAFLTDAELNALATRLDAMAETCKAHASELRRYRRLRPKAA